MRPEAANPVRARCFGQGVGLRESLPRILEHHLAVAVRHINMRRDHDLALIGETYALSGLFPGDVQSGRQNRHQYCDHRNHHEQLDQRESPSVHDVISSKLLMRIVDRADLSYTA